MDASTKEVYKPLILSASDEVSNSVIQELKNDTTLLIHDEIRSQVGDLIKLRNPQKKYPPLELDEAITDFFGSQSISDFGNWVYYPWRHCLVHMLPEEEFVTVRTVRNKYVITEEEQRELAGKKIGIIGLSVGQSVALTLALERGCGELRLADFDTLELSNLNRIRTGVHNLGVKKSVIAAREIAEIDPYLNVVLYSEGVQDDNIHDFFTKGGDLDLLIEECDSLEVKIKSRIKAKKLGIPVLMDTSDRGMIDIERFDREPERPILHGLLREFGDESGLVAEISNQYPEILMALLDFNKLSSGAQQSIQEIGKTITSWPQLASSVILGGGACGYYSRMILLGKEIHSDRYYVDLEKIANFSHGS
ncbi:molybdopterin/thiamine biosynthesis adenylyltransferase [Algoriphagus sp. 4150]|uniref:ThiF family adenylyltransferase n=1 Tax=Algoriphagus sp. 4150 TaxID=2817756 RepID=UPI002865552C|nr:ThiF family adenylyltransferase [Algoriphagus sp. 4150]MDR7129299.1 molybdopterin/thiamine biosynthesis adenylyltransferase [Algoriphagus sp. 4150]